MNRYRMSRILLALASAALAACTSLSPENYVSAPDVSAPDAAAPEPPPEDPPEVRLVASIEQQGCVLTSDNVEQVLLGASLRQADLAEIVPRLAQSGRVEVAGSGAIRVNTEACA